MLEEYREYFDRLIELSGRFIDRYGVLKAPELNMELDTRYLEDYRLFAFAKGTSTFYALYTLIDNGYYESAFTLTRTIYECYISQRYFNENFDLDLQMDMVTNQIQILKGKYYLDNGILRNLETGAEVPNRLITVDSMVTGKDKSYHNLFHEGLCALVHCNFAQRYSYLDGSQQLLLHTEHNCEIAHLFGLFVYCKLFESVALHKDVEFSDKKEAAEYVDLLVELTVFIFKKMNNREAVQTPGVTSSSISHKLFANLKNSLKEQLGRVEKEFVNYIVPKEGSKEKSFKASLLEDPKPSVYFHKIISEPENWQAHYPELFHLVGIPTESGQDVWQQTMDALDHAAEYRDKASDPYGFMLAVLTKNFGRYICKYDGPTQTRRFLDRVTNNFASKRYVFKMMDPENSTLLKKEKEDLKYLSHLP